MANGFMFSVLPQVPSKKKWLCDNRKVKSPNLPWSVGYPFGSLDVTTPSRKHKWMPGTTQCLTRTSCIKLHKWKTQLEFSLVLVMFVTSWIESSLASNQSLPRGITYLGAVEPHRWDHLKLNKQWLVPQWCCSHGRLSKQRLKYQKKTHKQS